MALGEDLPQSDSKSGCTQVLGVRNVRMRTCQDTNHGSGSIKEMVREPVTTRLVNVKDAEASAACDASMATMLGQLEHDMYTYLILRLS